MIELELANVSDLEITRPARQSAGRDQSADPTVIATGLSAIHELEDGTTRGPDGQEATISGRVLIDPVDNAGDEIDVRPGDFVKFSNFAGHVFKPRQVIRVEAFWEGIDIDHLEVEFS